MQSATPTTPERIEVRGSIINSFSVDAERHLWTLRLLLPPGAEFPYWTRPGPTTLYVERGMLAFTAVTGNAALTLGIDPIERQRAITGVEYRLLPGETASFGPGVQQSIRNPVTETTALIISMIAPKTATPFDGLWTSQGYPVVVKTGA